jgi:hypothetical protein
MRRSNFYAALGSPPSPRLDYPASTSMTCGIPGTLSTSLDRGGPEGDLMELNGWDSPRMLRRYGASARARRAYDRIMTGT